MNSQTAVVRTQPHHDIFQAFSLFNTAIKKRNKEPSIELVKMALLLLKQVPLTRTAVFQYFSMVFDGAAQNHVKNDSINPESQELIISEIHMALNGLIGDNPQAWAPVISTWSLELLGEISSRFSGKAHVTNLNEILQLWMGCRATRTLVDVNTKCLSSLIHLDTEACISALLDTSVKHSPNFDWVVAHVGSCFPNTVITRVLSVGLKDFAQNRSYDQVRDSPKLKSVVGILGHLAGSHAKDIREAIVEMFEWSLKESFTDSDLSRLHKKATVPYILQLVYLSPTLLSSICNETKNILNVDVIRKMSHLVNDWVKYFGTPEAIEEHITALILKCQSGGLQILNLLLTCAQITKLKACNDQLKSDIREKSMDILDTVFESIEDATRHGEYIDLLASCSHDIDEINSLFLSQNKTTRNVAFKLVLFLGHMNPSVTVKSLTYLLEYAKTPQQLALIPQILQNELVDKTVPPYADNGGYFSCVLQQILSRNIQKYSHNNEESLDLSQMWTNLLLLFEWELTGKALVMNFVKRALEKNFIDLTSVFSSEFDHVHIIADILDKSAIPDASDGCFMPPIEVILDLTKAVVNYFFICCRDQGTSTKFQGFSRTARLLKRLCVYSKVAKVLALRELLERALFLDDSVLFGAQNTFAHDVEETSLFKHNKKINKVIPLTKHSTVFNGGIIGSGKRKPAAPNGLPPKIVSGNIGELIAVLKACCALSEDNKYTEISVDSITHLSLLLVQLVSPDIMYNGLPWPEEEFSKVTIERDLSIRKMFTEKPLLWDLLSFVAVHRPTLCYCSVLLRALTATLIHQWKSMGDQACNSIYQVQLDTTIRVIDVMALGQLLPPPLSNVRDCLPHLKSFEIVEILRDCIWSYMRDHIPSPALFSCDANGIHWRDPITARPPERYTTALRIIMQRNIAKLGRMYLHMFVTVPTHQ